MSLVEKLRSASREATARKSGRLANGEPKGRQEAAEARGHIRTRRAQQAAERTALREIAPILVSALEESILGRKSIEISGVFSREGFDLLLQLGYALERHETNRDDEEGYEDDFDEPLPASHDECLSQLSDHLSKLSGYTPEHLLKLLRLEVDWGRFREMAALLAEDSAPKLKEYFPNEKYYTDWDRTASYLKDELRTWLKTATDKIYPTSDFQLSWRAREEMRRPSSASRLPHIFFAECMHRISRSQGLLEIDRQLEQAANLGRSRAVIHVEVNEDGWLELSQLDARANSCRIDLSVDELTECLTVRGTTVEVDAKESHKVSLRVQW